MPGPRQATEYTKWGQSQSKQTELITDVYVQFHTNRDREILHLQIINVNQSYTIKLG